MPLEKPVKPLRIGIVNDLALACEALRRVVCSDPALEPAWIARDGAEAVAMCAVDRPDAILMDLIMPIMDGVESTRRIMRATPCPILVVTATVSGNAGLVYDALGAGARDAVNTPTLALDGSVRGGAELIRRLKMIVRVASATPVVGVARSAPSSIVRTTALAPTILIGCSTGGPRALGEILAALPKPIPAAVIIVQHISRDFAEGLTSWLSTKSNVVVRLAKSTEQLRVGEVIVAGDDRHLVLQSNGTLAQVDASADALHAPSVDTLFMSFAQHGTPGVAVLLTGMGKDGAQGLLALRKAGWHTIAQDQATSVVWGMPGAAVAIDAAVQVLPLESIAAATLTARTRLSR
ncbi:MAG: chemotaxis-specific protein-glutamate methyltransferase CheB [Phycisphaerales bacterium]|nr:chemotaxis-specific protein-glutamate methyltransferase CheB [Phycisphaerales bacterium]